LLLEELDESPQVWKSSWQNGTSTPFHTHSARHGVITPPCLLLAHQPNQRIVGSGVLLDPRAVFIFAIIFFPPSLVDNETEMAVYKRAFCLVAMAYTQQAAMAFQPVGRPVVPNQPGCSAATSRSTSIPAILKNGPLRMSSSEDDGGVSFIENCNLFFRFSFMRTPFLASRSQRTFPISLSPLSLSLSLSLSLNDTQQRYSGRPPRVP
jgi:hypothetical protein